MRILFLSLSYLPSRRASSVQVTRMCAALARAGHTVTLLAKRGAETTAATLDDHAFYGVPPSFEIVKLPRPKRRGGGAVFSAAMGLELRRRRSTTDLVFSRDLLGAAMAAYAGLPVVFETHGIPQAPWLRWIWRQLIAHRNLRGMVAISEALRADLVAEHLVPAHAPVVVAHDAADLDVEPAAGPRHMAARPRIGYVGNLYPGRGVDLVLDLARRMPACDFELVGGATADLARWQATALPANAHLRGFQPPARLAALYRELDVVLMPYARSGVGVASGKSDTSRWCSPMKMFEYMASGAPIVSSDLPVLQEVLRDQHNALIAPAGDVDAWQRAVEALVRDGALRARLAGQARRDLEDHYTWDARVTRIATGLNWRIS